MIDNLEDNDDSIRAFVHDGVEHPPEGGQVFYEEVLDSVLPNERYWNPGLLDELSVETVIKERQVERSHSPGDALVVLLRTGF